MLVNRASTIILYSALMCACANTKKGDDGQPTGGDVEGEADGGEAEAEDGGQACAADDDCVPAECCHPTSCVPASMAPDCTDVICTLECRPGTLDCGQGHCACQDGQCTAIIDAPAEAD